MSDAYLEDDFILVDEWVEVSDQEGHRAALRHLATLRIDDRVYSVLGSMRREGEVALMLLREDQTVDGASEYVLVGDEQEAEQVVERFVAHFLFKDLADECASEDHVEACGYQHRVGEFCYCDDPKYLQ